MQQNRATILAGVLVCCMATSAHAGDDATATQRPVVPSDDAWITTIVEARLLVARDIPLADVNISTDHGVVTLSGSVDTRAQLEESIERARAVKGVRDVITSALSARN